MGILIMEATGSEGERLALEAGKVTDIAVGWDAELNSATFDSDAFDDAELEGIVFDALNGIDPDWRSHLQLVQ
jgi:hypothetical protein